MGCACNNIKKENIEQKKDYKKENFDNFNLNFFLSKNWIYIIIVLIILIVIYFIIANPFSSKNEKLQEFIVAPPGFIRGNLDDYTVGF
jgi:hypothetical protein